MSNIKDLTLLSPLFFRYKLNTHRATVKQANALKQITWMQQIVSVTESKLLELFPIGHEVDLPSREEIDSTLKEAINVTYRDTFEISDKFISELEDTWRIRAGEHFIKMVAERIVHERKTIEELDLDRNRVYKKYWRLMRREIGQKVEVCIQKYFIRT